MSGTKTLPNRPFPFVHSIIDRHGKRRHYFRRHGQKRVTLPGAWGSQEFQNAYRAALAGETAPPIEVGESRSKPGSVAAAVALYLGSMDFGALAEATPRERRRILEHFREAYGDRRFAALERKHVEPMVARKAPHAARSFLKALRRVVTVALRAGLCDADPTAGIRIRIRSTGGFRTWTEDDIAQFESFYPIGSRARLAFALLLYTGQRRGDVIRIGRQHVKGGVLTVHQAKTGVTVAIPIHPDLQAALAASEHLTFLTTATGKPFTGQGGNVPFDVEKREASVAG
jgi:integrase